MDYHFIHQYTTQHSNTATQRSTTQHNAAQRSTAQRNTTQHNAAQHSTAQRSTTQHSTAQRSTTQHNGHNINTTHTHYASYFYCSLSPCIVTTPPPDVALLFSPLLFLSAKANKVPVSFIILHHLIASRLVLRHSSSSTIMK